MYMLCSVKFDKMEKRSYTFIKHFNIVQAKLKRRIQKWHHFAGAEKADNWTLKSPFEFVNYCKCSCKAVQNDYVQYDASEQSIPYILWILNLYSGKPIVLVKEYHWERRLLLYTAENISWEYEVLGGDNWGKMIIVLPIISDMINCRHIAQIESLMNTQENKIIIIPFNIGYRATRFIKEQMRDPNQSNETTFKIFLSCHCLK